jgi:hypothetical protein
MTLTAYREDTNGGTATTKASESGIQAIRLKDSWDYLRLRNTIGTAGPKDATWQGVSYNTQDEIDTGSFTHTGGSDQITLKKSGYYLVTYTGGYDSTSGSRRNYEMRMTLDGAEISPGRPTSYVRGAEGIRELALSHVGIVQATSANQVLSVQTRCSVSGCNGLSENTTRQALSLVKIPDTSEIVD